MSKLQSMLGKNVLITGAAKGMGAVTARELAALGAARIILVDWDGESGTRLCAAINAAEGRVVAEFIYCDLSSMRQVRALAEDIKQRYEALHVLINNAGITDPVRRLNEDGIEMHVASCHLSHFLLTHCLLDLLKRSAPARVVVISSAAHSAGPGVSLDDFNNAAIWPGPVSHNAAFFAYSRAKLCNLFFMQILAEKLQGSGVTVNAVSPGFFVNTSIYRDMRGIFKLGANIVFGIVGLLRLSTAEKGARTHIYLASSPDVAGVSGKYFEDCKPKAMGEVAVDRNKAEAVWALSETLTGLAEH